MLPWVRPDPHPDFAADAKALLTALRADVDAHKGVPHSDHFKNREIWTSSWRRRSQPAGLHKASLAGPELGPVKCVWCEQLRSAKRELDVEHYRPKVAITEWAGSPSIVSDAPPPEIDVGPGYWWLAFEWTNYFLACQPCNQGWKRNLFPVDGPRGKCVEGVEQTEKPLLLDPASKFRTRDHFRWTVEGIMEPLSPEGYATIVTCGLNRRDLRVRRSKVARDIKVALDSFTTAFRQWREISRTQPLAERRQKDLEEKCHAARDQIERLGSRTEEFTSMVRWFVEERLGCTWEDLTGIL